MLLIDVSEFTYEYLNHTGQMTGVNYPNGMKASYAYLDNMEDRRLASIDYQTSGGDRISKFKYAYDTIGNITQWSKSLGDRAPITEEFTYDEVDQLRGWKRLLGDAITQTRNPSLSTTPAHFAYDWNYDPAGNRIKEEVTTPATGGSEVQEREWTPNNLNQLTTVKGPGPNLLIKGVLDTSSTVTVNGQPATMSGDNKEFQAWIDADAGQNKTRVNLSATATNPPAEAADAPPTEVSYDVPSSGGGTTPQPLTYDANGNTLSDGVRSYQWDGEDRLIKITYANGAFTTFDYDGSSRCRRITETNSSSVVVEVRTFVWDGLAKVERRAADGKKVIKRYYNQGEGHLKEGDIEKNDTELTFYYTKDHLGNIREMTDYAGIVRARYEYDPWGRTQQLEGDLVAELGYTGHYRHHKSGFYLAPFRAYDPVNARWLNRDPIKENGGINVYGYVLNGPLSAIDPLGLDPAYPPPLNIPSGGEWKWVPDANNSRGGLYVDGAGGKASWDAAGSHWDVDDTSGKRRRYDRWGNSLTAKQAHTYTGPNQKPLKGGGKSFNSLCPRSSIRGYIILDFLSILDFFIDSYHNGGWLHDYRRFIEYPLEGCSPEEAKRRADDAWYFDRGMLPPWYG